MNAIAKNRTETVAVNLDGECLGYNAIGRTCVRPTTCNRFAVIASVPNKNGDLRLIKVFATADIARRYNLAIGQ